MNGGCIELPASNTGGTITLSGEGYLTDSSGAGCTVDRGCFSDLAGAGAGLTQQEVRDAMKLAPTGGSPSAGSVDQHLDDIELDTQDLQTQIGTAGDGLTAQPWNSAWDAEVQSECADALAAINLNHLLFDPEVGDVTTNSVIAKLASKNGTAAWADYDNTTDSLPG
jgi:hypothetical protein